MALDAATAQEMIRKLADDRTKYLDTLTRAHDVLAQALNAAAIGTPVSSLTTDSVNQNAGLTADGESGEPNSNFSIDESETDDDESLFVRQTLPQEQYELDGLREHVRLYEWTQSGRDILGDMLDERQPPGESNIFPNQPGELEGRSHLPHYSIFDVGDDGVPLPIRNARNSSPCSRAAAIWKNIKSTNSDLSRQRQAVGRITIIREPSPILFAAIHYTMNNHFDMDEIFQLLVDSQTKAIPHRPFSTNHRHQSTFIFSLDYFTVVGEECQPMTWQKADEELGESETHVALSRCSSVVALSLAGKPVSEIKSKGRRGDRKIGKILDPFDPWRVLSIQAYPDWKSSIDSHDSTKHYVNGPEAFLVTLKAEFKDAQKRLLEVYRKISDLVRPPANFMFNRATRDRLLFEDDEFTCSRKYFWAYQSLGIMNEDIREMITAYKSTFTDSIWNGKNKIIWPGDQSISPRFSNWRKRMLVLRKEIEYELHQLEIIENLNDGKMKEIKGLRDNLFSGTSVLESRRSVEQAAITVQQGHNIKLLTLVTIFFLPLTFVTSIFGMTNLPTNHNFRPFGILTVIICLPTYMLIGSLNTTSGLRFWTQKTHHFFTRIARIFAAFLALFGYKPKWTQTLDAGIQPQRTRTNTFSPLRLRSQSASEGMAARDRCEPLTTASSTFPLSTAPTLDQPISHLSVPQSATIKFGKTSSDIPRTPTEKTDPTTSLALHNIGSDAAASAAAAPSQSMDEARPSWFSRLFLASARERKPQVGQRELC